MSNIIQEIDKEFDEGSFASVAPDDWNEDNIIGYNASKEDYKKFLNDAIRRVLEYYNQNNFSGHCGCTGAVLDHFEELLNELDKHEN